jgi:hypothetical protein
MEAMSGLGNTYRYLLASFVRAKSAFSSPGIESIECPLINKCGVQLLLKRHIAFINKLDWKNLNIQRLIYRGSLVW